MRLSEIQNEWTNDSKIDALDLGAASLSIPNLHAKYLAILTTTKLSLRKCEADYYRMRRKKYRYYRGELTMQELSEENWDQWQGTKPLKTEMDEFLITDTDLISLQDKVDYYKAIIYQLEQIMRSLNSRTWDIKNALEWQKIQNGY